MAAGALARRLILLLLLVFLPPLHGRLHAPLELADGLQDRDPSEAILEMLHIDKLTAPQRTKPHPYMKQVYRLLNLQEDRDPSGSDGTLVQSFRSIQGSKYGPPGWIWFNVSHLKSSMVVAELVLLRKTLNPEPLSVSVAVHSVSLQAASLTVSEPLEERLLALDQLPRSGYDVFNVSAALARQVDATVGFQLRYTDESGSLVLHEALTQSLYCLNATAQGEPLLVAYQRPLGHPAATSSRPEHGQRRHCKRQPSVGRPHHHLPSHCTLRQRYVDLRSLSDWILEPLGFHISFCRGTCSLGNSRELENEDRFKRRKSGEETEKGSGCIEQELSSQTVMYRSGKDNVIIKKLKNMRAKSCVCR